MTTTHSKKECKLDAIARELRLVRRDDEDLDSFASRLHYRLDDLIREHAQDIGAQKIIELLDLHDTIERLVP